MRVLLLGGTKILLSLFENLLSKVYIESISVITSPRHATEKFDDVTFLDKINNAAKNSSLKDRFQIHNLESIENNKFVEICNQHDIRISISAAWIYKKKYIDQVGPILQMHNTLLPKYRGGASYSWMIMSGEREAATTLFIVDENIDTGDIVMSRCYVFPDSCRTPMDYMQYAESRAINDLIEFTDRFHETKKIPPTIQQNEIEASYFPRLHTLTNGCINWDWDRDEILRFICAFDEPYTGAHTRCTRHKEKLFFSKVFPVDQKSYFHPYQYGLIYNKLGQKIYVCCRGGGLCIEHVFDQNRVDMIPQMKLGDRFFSTHEDLNFSRSNRAFYGPKK